MITSPQFYFDTPRMLREGFALLAPYVVSAHAKDIVMKGGPGQISFHMDEVPPGEGMLDYRAYLRELSALGRDVPLMLEHFDKPEYDRGRDHIRRVGREIGVASRLGSRRPLLSRSDGGGGPAKPVEGRGWTRARGAAPFRRLRRHLPPQAGEGTDCPLYNLLVSSGTSANRSPTNP